MYLCSQFVLSEQLAVTLMNYTQNTTSRGVNVMSDWVQNSNLFRHISMYCI